jgi:hypothetical protein
MKSRSLLAALVVLVLLSLAACGTPPATLTDIAVFPGATPLEAGQNEMADTVSQAMIDSMSQENVKSEVKLYSVPAGVTWDEVKSFYTDQLSGTDWKADSDLSNESELFSAVGWTRGSLASEQALIVSHGADVTGSGAFLIVLLISE